MSAEPAIGTVGLGIGRVHLEGYRRYDLTVAAICDLNETRLADCARDFGIERTYTSAEALIDDPEVGVIDLAVQPWQREALVEYAAAAGKPIFCQKPLAMDLRQAVRMVETCERRGVPLMVNHNSCFVPGFLAVEPYLTPEYLGAIYHAEIHNYGFWTTFPERHIIPAMMVHHLALVHKWFGPIETVYCQAHGHDHSLQEGEVMAVAQLRHESGVQTLLVNDWAYLEARRRGPSHSKEAVRVQGTHGAIFGHSEDMTVYTTTPRPVEIKPVISGPWFPDAFGLGMRHFMDCLATGATPITDGRGNLHVLQAVFAAWQSTLDNRVVRVDEISLDADYDLNP
ncbi:MAG: Gfo/Idh/MocA family oxidoreductase [Armatimonadetes bacterium]|nr:Gfo/Idh/MocA family oxidoreductase [Armatimonadota bacterium]